jgi:hypothetical protein
MREKEMPMNALLAFAIFIPMDATPFKVHEKDIVRIVLSGISGSQFDVKIEGPAKVVSTGDIHEIRNGHSPIGAAHKEFNIKPSGKGKVKVTATVKPPQPDAKPKITHYEFEVE